MKMKIIIVFNLLLFHFCLIAQTKSDIIKLIEKKDVKNLVNKCILPFDLNIQNNLKDNFVYSKKGLENALIFLIIKKKYFNEFFKHKHTTRIEKFKIDFDYKNFNEEGEFESESTLSFVFTKIKNRIYLKAIILYG